METGIKIIVFDLDGVLVKAKEIHFKALNYALGPNYSISISEHLTKYDGLKTIDKLKKLSIDKGLPQNLYDQIWSKKQEMTQYLLSSITENKNLGELFIYLRTIGIKIAVCSNSIKLTIDIVLSKLALHDFVDLVLSNEDVNLSKPYPEIYWKAMMHFGFTPLETLIIEDSPTGLRAAILSGAQVYRVSSPDELNINLFQKILKTDFFKKYNYYAKWVDKKMNVLIPMAGAGSRFSSAGYTFPKPLIDVCSKPMIQVVIENLGIDANFIYIVQKNHREKFNLDLVLKLLTPECKIIETNEITQGAACTALLATEFINNDDPLFFANSDQFVEWNPVEFFYKMIECNADGGIPVFNSTHPKWSFAKLDSDGFVVEVQEKKPISDLATVGYYYWKYGRDFVKYANLMISKDKRVNNEFYVCPVYNEAIADKMKIFPFQVKRMWGLGTPEDLNSFINFMNNDSN